jgi:long-subunit acyl-CoA synthetase (AMP-forming)
MTQAQIEGFIRSVMLLGAGFAINYGIDEASWAIITASVVGLAGVAWSIYSNSTTRMVEQVAKSPNVAQVVVESDKMANSIPSQKVVPYDAARNL